MPRIARAIAVGFPHHVVQRGNNRENVFFDKEDRARYLSFLKKYSSKWNAPILAYCLMSNHVHLLTKPKKEESLFKMMQCATLCYTQYINEKYDRTGRLWESRYHSCIVDKEGYLWAVVRYIEQNPGRAGLVKNEEDYPYSSAPAHINGIEDDVLGEALFTEAQRKGYAEFVKSNIPKEQLMDIRRSSRSGRPFGGEEFMKSMERKIGRIFKERPRGRPRKD